MEHVLHKLNMEEVICSSPFKNTKNNSRNKKKISTKNIRKTKKNLNRNHKR